MHTQEGKSVCRISALHERKCDWVELKKKEIRFNIIWF